MIKINYKTISWTYSFYEFIFVFLSKYIFVNIFYQILIKYNYVREIYYYYYLYTVFN
jgi:hypothetical protein